MTLTCANPSCGREFAKRVSDIVNDHPCCSSMCAGVFMPGYTGADRRTRRKANDRARKLRQAQTWDGIGDGEILERDGWRCRVPQCRFRSRKIDRQKKFPHPRSASVDHIVPLSLGGDDTAMNKRAAHHGCNIARGNRMDIEQLPLFGSLREPPLMSEVVLGRPLKLCACGNEVAPGRISRCSSCAQKPKRIKTPRVCEHCGKTFDAYTATVCSNNCWALRRYYANRDAILDRLAAQRGGKRRAA